jgi:hypothetical protein
VFRMVRSGADGVGKDCVLGTVARQGL